MQIEINKLPDSEIEITGEISAGDFESCREQTIKELSENIQIDGFRPGKIPEKILIEKIGEQAIMERMAEIALQKEYFKIIEEKNIQAIGRPEIIITKIARNNPLGFKLKTAVMPEIELPDYKKIANEAMEEKEIKAREKKRIEVLEKIVASSKIEIPKILVGPEQEGLKKAKYNLILNEIAKKEKIEISEEEARKEAEKLVEYYKNFSQSIDLEKAMAYTYGILRNEKVFQFLESC
ncbi:trigger factor family protein [Patescibacteria group bacterium]|nr:trigger factor family protein [Patescibacteria group bacterium]